MGLPAALVSFSGSDTGAEAPARGAPRLGVRLRFGPGATIVTPGLALGTIFAPFLGGIRALSAAAPAAPSRLALLAAIGVAAGVTGRLLREPEAEAAGRRGRGLPAALRAVLGPGGRGALARRTLRVLDLGRLLAGRAVVGVAATAAPPPTGAVLGGGALLRGFRRGPVVLASLLAARLALRITGAATAAPARSPGTLVLGPLFARRAGLGGTGLGALLIGGPSLVPLVAPLPASTVPAAAGPLVAPGRRLGA